MFHLKEYAESNPMKNLCLKSNQFLVLLSFIFLTACAVNSNVKNMQSKPILNGGASAKFVCEPLITYPNPLYGMGEIKKISAPLTGPFPFFEFLEGPVWISSVNGGSLFFSDLVAPARIWKLTPPSITPTLFLQNSGSNGLAIDGDDQLVLADREAKRITKLDPITGVITGDVVPADGKFKPNDLIVRSDNNIYFTAPKVGFYRVKPDGTLSEPQTGVANPNGIALSPDELTLYVGDFSNKTITLFKLNTGGDIIAGSEKLFTTTDGNKVDGMTIDCAGNLYAGTESGVEVFNTSGETLGIIQTGRASNAAFGGADRKTLYVTARTLLKSVKLKIPGLPN